MAIFAHPARWVALLCLGLMGGCADPSPLADLEPGETGRVVRIIDGDSLVLETGLTVRLVGLEAPALQTKDRPAQPFAKDARRQLEDLVLGRRVRLYYSGMTRDRYERALAHIRTIDDLGPDHWVNLALVERGAARVRTYPDTAPLGNVLLAAETQARQTQQGLWALRAYDVADASSLDLQDRGFFIVGGKIDGPVAVDASDQLCAVGLVEAKLRLVADRSAPGLCALPGGTLVEARGYLSGNRLYVSHDLNIQQRQMPGPR